MRLIVYRVAAIALSVLLFAACNSGESSSVSRTSNQPSTPSSKTPGDGIRRITVTELKESFDKGEAFIVDVRLPEAYNSDHIKGSVNIPEATTASRISEFPLDKLIVTYCS